GARVEAFAPKPISDGASSDDQDRIYLTDPEHSAVLAVEPDRRLRTLVKDPKLRWPDGLSFGPAGPLYVTCSPPQDLLLPSPGAPTRRIRSIVSSPAARPRLGIDAHPSTWSSSVGTPAVPDRTVATVVPGRIPGRSPLTSTPAASSRSRRAARSGTR